MAKEFGAVKVIHLPTGEERLIKWERFNPEIHKQIGDPFTMNRSLDYSIGVSKQDDPMAAAVARGEARREEEQTQNNEENQLVDSEEKDDNTVEFDATQERTLEELEQLTRQQLMAYCKHRSIKTNFKQTKQDLLAQVGILIPNPSQNAESSQS